MARNNAISELRRSKYSYEKDLASKIKTDDAFVVIVLSDEPKQNQGRGLVDRQLVKAPQKFLLLAVPRRLFCFGSLVILDVARCYLWLFTLYINIKIGKNSC